MLLRRIFFSVFALAFCAGSRASEPVSITILHTNDIHSHFRPEKTDLSLGGIARIKTAIDQIRRENPNSLLVDGGDWSEGNIYYTQGAGAESLRMMNAMGYDVAVVGNHDWLNGPDVLLNSISQSGTQMKLVAANVVAGKSPSTFEQFRKLIPPYAIQEIAGVKIAFIGLVTYEFIYDSFLLPLKPDDPKKYAEDLAFQLKHGPEAVDAVVVISHNRIDLNQSILEKSPDVDLIVGAHDHVQLVEPILVKRAGAPDAWIVETGCWGKYLGRVDLQIVPHRQGRGVSLNSYRLKQIDFRVPEDPAISKRVQALEDRIEQKMGPVFHENIGDSEIELTRDGMESRIGDFATDAYLAATHADLALDDVHLIEGEIHPGPIKWAEAFNSNPTVWNPATEKTWSVKVVPLSGRVLKIAVNLLFLSKKVAQLGLLSFSGLDILYDPLFNVRKPSGAIEPGKPLSQGLFPDFSNYGAVIKEMKVQGRPVDDHTHYNVAVSGGIYEALKFIDSKLPIIPLDQTQDTGVEAWRIVANRIQELGTIRDEDVQLGSRLQTVEPDLGVLTDDVKWEVLSDDGSTVHARVTATVRNFGRGTSPDSGITVDLFTNLNGIDFSTKPAWSTLTSGQAVGALGTLQSQSFEWELDLPRGIGLIPVGVAIRGTDSETNHTNDSAIHWFKLDEPRKIPRRPPHP